MNDFDKLTPEQRALLESVSIPICRSPGCRRSTWCRPTAGACSTCQSWAPLNPHLPGRWPAGSSSRTGKAASSCPRLRASPSRSSPSPRSSPSSRSCPTASPRFVDSHPEMPVDAPGKESQGQRICRDSKGRVVQEARNAFMKVEETGQLGFYRFSKTALPIGRDFTNRAQVLRVEGLDGVQGCVLGRYPHDVEVGEAGHPPLVPAGDRVSRQTRSPDGPTLASVMELAETAQGLPRRLAADAGDSKDRRSRLCRRSIDGPPEPPPYERNPDDDVDFGP